MSPRPQDEERESDFLTFFWSGVVALVLFFVWAIMGDDPIGGAWTLKVILNALWIMAAVASGISLIRYLGSLITRR